MSFSQIISPSPSPSESKVRYTPLALHCCLWASSSCGKQELFSSCAAKASHMVASLIVEHRL